MVPYFFCKLLPPRPGFPADATATEMQLMQDHAAYWQVEAERGHAIAFGPVFDPAGVWGLGLAEAKDEAEMTRLTEADPVIQAMAGFRYEICPIPSLILRGSLGFAPTGS